MRVGRRAGTALISKSGRGIGGCELLQVGVVGRAVGGWRLGKFANTAPGLDAHGHVLGGGASCWIRPDFMPTGTGSDGDSRGRIRRPRGGEGERREDKQEDGEVAQGLLLWN